MDVRSKIEEDEDIKFYWSMVSVDIDDEQDSCELLHSIVDLWLTIRGNSITSSWLEMYKKANQKATKGKKGLRKDLKSKQTEN